MSIVALADFKSFLQITGTDKDTILQIYADYVQSEVEAHIDQKLVQASRTEPIKVFGSHYDLDPYRGFQTRTENPGALTRYFPVSNVSVTQSGSALTEDTDFTVDEATGFIEFYTGVNDSQQRLKATYTYGYSSSTIPSDLKLVMMEGVKRMYENGGASTEGSGNVKSKSIKDFSVSYGENSDTSSTVMVGSSLIKAYLASNSLILQKYRRITL